MANNVYAKAAQKFVKGLLDWDAGAQDFKAVLIDSADYTPDLNADEFYSSVPGAARIGTPQSIANRVATQSGANTNCDGDDVTFLAVTGDSIEKVLIFRDTGVEATSELVALLDVSIGAPSGIDITIKWNANGVFRATT